jgi:hypothetical protein
MVEVDMEETSKNFIAVPADPPALPLPMAVFAPPPPPPPPVTYIITFVIPLGRVHVPLEVKVCTEARPESNPDDDPVLFIVPATARVAPDGTVKVSPESPRATAVPVAGLSLFDLTSLLISETSL